MAQRAPPALTEQSFQNQALPQPDSGEEKADKKSLAGLLHMICPRLPLHCAGRRSALQQLWVA